MSAGWIGKAMIWGIVLVAGATAQADPPTFQITSIFSNLDGSVQFIRLAETAGLDHQNHFTGLKLTSTHNGVAKEFTFVNDLRENTAHASIVIAAMPDQYLPILLLGPGGGGWYCCFPVDYRMPERFLATDGGTIDFAGADELRYSSLPTDGEHALHRDGTVGDALLPGPRCIMPLPVPCPTNPQIAQTLVTAVEYHNPALAHYFISASAPDLEALDSGRTSGWERTGFTFPVTATASGYPGGFFPGLPPTRPICRFYLPPEFGDSHFLSASPAECTEMRERYPAFVLESDATFYAALPDLATGECPPPHFVDVDGDRYSWIPVFRLWNRRVDTNHRYTTDLAVRSAMIDLGYVSEGYGPAGVAFCVPHVD